MFQADDENGTFQTATTKRLGRKKRAPEIANGWTANN
jgi:hypothetical protein